jgi:pectinesterase inhibitor-like protein
MRTRLYIYCLSIHCYSIEFSSKKNQRMSLCNKFFASLVFSLAAIFIFFTHSNADSALITNICNGADDVQYCRDLFLLDPRSDTVDGHGLALIAVQITINKIQDTLDTKISDFVRNTTDPVGKQRIGVCQSDYTNAVTKYTNVFQSTDKKAYQDAIDGLGIGSNDIVDCQNIYRRTEPIAESPISADNTEIAIKSTGVILTVIEYLIRN